MKKMFIIFLTSVFSLFTFSGCNEDLGFGNYSFKKAHINLDGQNNGICVNIKSWHDNEVGCEVKMENGSSLYLSEGTYMLVEDYCPICGK